VDMDMLNAVESAAVMTAEASHRGGAGGEAHKSNLAGVSGVAVTEDVQGGLGISVGDVTMDDDTNLDEFDEEIFAADLEDIVAKYDMQRPSSTRVAASIETPPQPIVRVNEPHIGVSEDEFGDLDDADFEGLLPPETIVSRKSKEKDLSQTFVCTRSYR
jgi:hypothetical protein